ncbi:hypothetical protein [Cerasicoccus maritimus]|uniref:hypothetical protein n=1 Tax=Cerasicoccus maritimus TaxID=490089 RepID=UPI002852C6B6|nr:hypothetical protein [Cerasicoccus maritimus]
MLPSLGNAVSLRFVSLEDDIDDVYYMANGEKVFISSFTGSLSQNYDYPAQDSALKLYQDVIGVDGAPTRKLMWQEKLPKDESELIAVLIRKNTQPDHFYGYIIVDSGSSRPALSVTTVNLSKYNLAFQLDNDKYLLDSLDTKQVEVSAQRMNFIVRIAALNDDEWKVVYSNPLAIRPGIRLLILLRDWRPTPGSKDTSVEFFSIYDRPPAEPE